MLTIQQLSKAFKSEKDTISVLNNITTKIVEGDFVMIMGESGAGKSTFLNCISTLDKPTSGSVLLDGKNILELKNNEIQKLRLEKVGFIFQENHMIETLTVVENVMISRLQIDKDAKSRAMELLQQLRIEHIANKMPHQISGGERQRCAIARALMNEPKILFADEPTASLNPMVAAEIMEILKELNNQGQTIVMVTHSIKMASYGTRLLLLSSGTFGVDQPLQTLNEQERVDKIVSLVVDVL
jgi:putative ABC transport system ATP-binding protein